MEKTYEVSFEIAGSAAMFTRPDSGAAQVSYPAPTFSAAKGMFEAIARWKSACIRPIKVEICKPIKYHKYTTNYGGPLRKSNQMAQGSSYQIPATILIDVCYRMYGIVEEIAQSPHDNNHLHALQDFFNRRLNKGRLYYTPCLGWKEFVPSYVGEFREGTKKQADINIVIPSMLHSVFDKISDGQVAPSFAVDAVIKEGELIYAK
ncbi:MAG: CRISPR-associated protein Cas5 [Deltaproteobacteria bacterium]|nr:CRISPR-associated protein Cas5 [Deltaproteobacteria bacterium]